MPVSFYRMNDIKVCPYRFLITAATRLTISEYIETADVAIKVDTINANPK